MITIGIDPGIDGAMAVIRWHEDYANHLPTLMVSKTKRQLDIRLIHDWLEHIRLKKGDDVEVYLEKVHSMPKQGVASSFNFGKAAGMLEGMLTAFPWRLHLITPQKWKQKAGLIGMPKDMARTKAILLFPKIDLHLKKDVNKADALLIAHYGPQCV